MHVDNLLSVHAENVWLKREVNELREKLASQKREFESWTKAPTGAFFMLQQRAARAF